MEGQLAKRCRSDFDSIDRQRGEDYFRSTLVELVAVGDRGIHAIVQGSSQYDVFLGLDGMGYNELSAYCSCPRYDEGFLCKHLWATIRTVDEQYQLKESIRGSFDIVDLDPDLFDIGEALGSKGKLVRKKTPNRVSKEIKSGGEPPTKIPQWKTKLANTFRIAVFDQAPPKASTELLKIQERRHWFAISLDGVADRLGLQIELYESKTKLDGEWGVPIKSRVSHGQISAIQDVSTRRILSLLDWETSERYDSYNFSNFNDENHSDWSIVPELCKETLDALCATERFVWNLTSSNTLAEYRTIQRDTDRPWRFLIRLEPASKKGLVKVVPTLQRTAEDSTIESRDISKVVASCHSGAILFEESVGIVSDGDSGWLRAWHRQGAFEIPSEDLQDFIKAILSRSNHPPFEIDERLGVTHFQEKPQGKIILSQAMQSQNYLTAETFFKYNDVELRIDDNRDYYWSDSKNGVGNRDRQAEAELIRELESIPINRATISSEGIELRILKKCFTELMRQLLAKSWDVVAHGKLQRTASNFNIKVSSHKDWFDLNADVDFGGMQVALPALLQAVRKGENFVILDDGTHGVLPEEWLRRFAGMEQVGEVEGDVVRFRRNQALMLDMLLAEQQDVSVDRNFADWCRRLKKFSGVRPNKQPRGFQGELRGYQEEGLGWFRFLSDFEFGGCLADDMGLGKTVQVLALLESRRNRKLKKEEFRKPSIVIVPKSLVFNWIDEGSKFAPKLKIVDYTGLDRSSQIPNLRDCDLIVTTYATFRLDVEILKEIEFDYAILDEAQAIKNPSALATKAVRLIQADHRLAMTGTPIENHLGDLWSLFDFLNPGMLGNATANSFNLSVDEDGHRLQSLSNALRPFILRRTKEQVLTELPSKSEQTLYCDLSPKQKKLYNELRDHYRVSLTSKVKEVGIAKSKIHVLEALLRLRQAACDPRLIDPKQGVVGAKIELLMEQLSDVIAEGHKVLVFSQFTSLLALVKKGIEAKKWEYEYLDGKTTKRADHVQRFQEDPKCSLFLISLKAGGLGLNLTAADYVYILDPWWNPAAESQAIDRAHRMGQQKPVMAYRMIARGTVEDKIVQLQQSKRQLADAIITADQSLLQKLSMDDLQVLFE